MNDKMNNLVQELKENLQNSFEDFEGLYVYGSQVNGTPNKDSDIDIVAIVDAPDREKRRYIWGVLSDLDYKYDVVIDLHPMTRQELEKNYIFHNEVVNKGVFYAAA
ncbi:MAG: nucleotidyltransferase domain-containing protein [Endomicrobium sp.]|jgi:predicted nucleotidyltransferase|nr:nucleotidyltransferase domain-containing protein [Endomicrobium sp.]